MNASTDKDNVTQHHKLKGVVEYVKRYGKRVKAPNFTIAAAVFTAADAYLQGRKGFYCIHLGKNLIDKAKNEQRKNNL